MEGRSSGYVERGSEGLFVFSPCGLAVWTPGFPGKWEGDPHTSSECISDACDPLPPLWPPRFPLSSSPSPYPSPRAAGEGNWACGDQGLEAGPSFGCVMPTPRTLANYLFVSLHQKRSAPNQGEILGGGAPNPVLLNISPTSRDRLQERQRRRVGKWKHRRGQ